MMNSKQKARPMKLNTFGNAANAVGRGYAWMDMIGAIIIGLIMIIIGVYMLNYKIKRTETETANITKDSVQTTTGTGKKRKTEYIAHYEYTPSTGPSSGTLFQNLTEIINKYYSSGETATVYYNPDDPVDRSLRKPINPKMIGAGLIILAILAVIISYIILQFVRKNKGAAQIYGGGRLIGNIID